METIEFELWVVVDGDVIIASFTQKEYAQAFVDGMNYIDGVCTENVYIQEVPAPKY